ncbi:MAG: IS30 family transposase [Hyphomicrobiaceae bacterium]
MYQHLSRKDRVAIAVLRAAGHSLEEIALQLRIHRSTVSRELRRNGDAHRYDAGFAHKLARGKRSLSKKHKRIVEKDSVLEAAIRKHLIQLRRSPEQIAHVLGLSHHTVYRWTYRQRENLNMYLPRAGKRRRPYGKAKEFLRGWTKHVRSIAQRPKIVERRARIGDWEGDTVVGADRTRLLVHIDRRSRCVVANLVSSGNADIVAMRCLQRSGLS